MKKTVIISEMFDSVATPSEKKKALLLWEKGNKGSWTVFQLRVIKMYWDAFIVQKEKPTKPVRENTSSIRENEPRMVKINHRGNSWYEPM